MVSNGVKTVLKSKFRGVYMGVLMGDCLGRPFEHDIYLSSAKITTQRFFDALYKNSKLPYKSYSCYFAMTKVLSKYLIENESFDCQSLAKQMFLEYKNDANRNYDKRTRDIFENWLENSFDTKKMIEMSKENHSFDAFDAAMISPVALLHHGNTEKLEKAIYDTVSIINSNETAQTGAFLQALAIQQALNSETIECDEYLRQLQANLTSVKKEKISLFTKKLQMVTELLKYDFKNQHDQDKTIVDLLGNSSNTLESIPLAIYCFLKGLNKIDRIEAENFAISSIHYAISLGGATNLNASLVGAITGAFYGKTVFDNALKKHIENPEGAIELSDLVYEKYVNKYEVVSK